MSHGIPVRAAINREFHKLGHGDTIRNAAHLLLSTSQQDFPVMHGDQVVGLLGRNLLLKSLAAEGPDAYVAGIWIATSCAWIRPPIWPRCCP